KQNNPHDPHHKKVILALARRWLIIQRRLAPFIRRRAILSVRMAIDLVTPTPEREKKMWGKISSFLGRLEREESGVARLLRNKELFEDWVDGYINHKRNW
ncbi:MAG: hypothetical protein AABW68_03750, partial [archaeon]